MKTCSCGSSDFSSPTASKCRGCKQAYNRAYYSRNRDKIISQNTEYVNRNRNKVSERRHVYWETNKDRLKKWHKNYRDTHREARAYALRRWYNSEAGLAWRSEYSAIRRANSKRHYQRNWAKIRRQFKERWDADPAFRLRHNVKRMIGFSLKGGKRRRHWENLVGYTLNELRTHLEKQFQNGMTWENYGKWHVDHIRPVVSFKITDANCEEFKNCWALSNLQPLWAKENLSKGSKIR